MCTALGAGIPGTVTTHGEAGEEVVLGPGVVGHVAHHLVLKL